MKKKSLALILMLFSGLIFSQVGINTTTPDPSSILDIVSTNKGLLAPRVNLTSMTQKIGTAANATGLLVFNNGTTLISGYYFWNGTEWRNIDNSSAVTASIATLVCSNAYLSPATYSSGVAYSGYLRVPYTGGNGGKYLSGSTVTVNGLDFKLNADKLEYGDGELVFSVSGTPTVSSPTTITVPINSTLVPFVTAVQSCSATVGGSANADIKEVAVMGPLVLNNEGGYANYHQYLTTPDGLDMQIKIPV